MIVEWLLVLVVVVLIAANAMFVAAEFSLVTVDRPTVARLAETDPRAKSLREALRTMSTQLSGAQLGITVTSLVVGFIAEPSIAALLGRWFWWPQRIRPRPVPVKWPAARS